MDADTGMDPLYRSHMGDHGLCRSHNKAYTGKYSSAYLPDLVFLNLNKKVTGTQTALQVVALASVQTLLRAAVGFLIGMVAGLVWRF